LNRHTRHRSDGFKIPTNYTTNYSKYIKNPKKTGKSKSKNRADSRTGSDDSNLINSIQIFNSRRPSYFDKKFSYVSDVNKTISKRSPSITIFKKKRIGKNTGGNNSPILSSTDSLQKKPNRNTKHKRHLTMSKLLASTSDNIGTVLTDKNANSSKVNILKRKKKSMISKYIKKTKSYSKPVSPHIRMVKSKSKNGNMTKQVSTRRTSINTDDLVIYEPKGSKSNTVSEETIAQVPFEMSVKRSFCDDRHNKNTHTQSDTGSKSNFSIFKEAQFKHNASKPRFVGAGHQKQLDFSRLPESSKGQPFKNTQFIIPQNLSRKKSIEKDNLSKFLKENHSVQSHSIHISELLYHPSNKPSQALFKKSPLITSLSSISRPGRHKRVKSHNFINVSQ
jgi:hypothetical protein